MICQKLGLLPDSLFADADSWRPYPKTGERQAWQALPAATRQACIAAGEAHLGYVWPLLPATEILAYRRDGNRTRYQAPYFARRHALIALVLAECCEGRGRFLDEIVNGIWCICEESSWSLPAHLAYVDGNGGLPDPNTPMVDLFAAETGGILACVLYLLEAELNGISNLLPARLRREIETRIIEPALARDDFWWMGLASGARTLNNWTPWIVSNWLLCMLLADRNPGRREASLFKAAGCLDRYIAQMPADGGCDEGPGYWGRAAASLFDCLECLKGVSGGALAFYDDPMVQAMGRFIVDVHIAGEWYVNFADAGARIKPRAHTIYGYGVRTGDTDLMRLGASIWQQSQSGKASFDLGGDVFRALQALFQFPITTSVETPAPFIPGAWLPDTEIVTARDVAGSPQGWFLAAKGGHNGERHNHNDVGTFIVYRDGAPLLVDAGVGEYTRQTFGPERYSIWTMRSEFHNLLPTVDGVGQSPGKPFCARHAACQMDDETVEFALELQEAYPPEAKLEQWRRRILFERGKQITITDRYTLAADVAEIVFNMLTPSLPTRVGENQIRLTSQMLPDAMASAAGMMAFEADHFELTLGEIPIEDSHLSPVWGKRLHTIRLLLRNPARTGTVRCTVTADAGT
jgi:hypothetical protein